jgi:hypothetical protein
MRGRPAARRRAAGVGGATAYIGVAAAVPHDGRSIPPWPMTGATLTVVAHDGRLPQAPLPAADH